MIKIHLSRLLGERRLTQKDLSEATGIRAATINEIYNELAERINLEHLDRICGVLDCTLPELMEYVPNTEPKTGEHLILEYHGGRGKKSNQS